MRPSRGCLCPLFLITAPPILPLLVAPREASGPLCAPLHDVRRAAAVQVAACAPPRASIRLPLQETSSASWSFLSGLFNRAAISVLMARKNAASGTTHPSKSRTRNLGILDPACLPRRCSGASRTPDRCPASFTLRRSQRGREVGLRGRGRTRRRASLETGGG